MKPYTTGSYRYLRYVSPDGSYGVMTDIYFRGTVKSVTDGIGDVRAENAAPLRTDYYDLQGRRIGSVNSAGGRAKVVIKRITFIDGTVQPQIGYREIAYQHS